MTSQIAINPIAGQVSGVAFTVSGACTMYPSLEYIDSGSGSGVVASGATSTPFATSTWSFTHPGLPVGSHSVTIEEIISAASGTSNTFAVSNPDTITPHAPSGTIAGQPFTFTGTLFGYAIAPSLTYHIDSGSPTALTGVTVSGWSESLTAPASGTHTITVSDGTVSGSVGFTTGAASVTHTITPHAPSGTIAGEAFTFTGTVSGYASAPSLTYHIDSGSSTALTGVTVSGWSESLTAPASGSHTITVSDGTVSGSVGFTTAAAPSGTVVTWDPAEKSTTITLSNSNKTATTSTAVAQTVRANVTVPASGTIAWEVTATEVTADWTAGLINASYFFASGGQIGGDASGVGFYPSNPPQGVFYAGNDLSGGTAVCPNGDIISFVVNGEELWVSTATMRETTDVIWNNSTTADPSTLTGGIPFTGMGAPRYPAFNSVEGGSVATINGGDTAFSTFLTTYLAAHTSIQPLGGAAAAHTITPATPTGVIAGTAFTFTGGLGGYTSAPSLTSRLDGGTPLAMTGVTASGWSESFTVSASGAHSIVVSDGTVSGSASFTAAASGTVREWTLNPGENGSFWVDPFKTTAAWITSGSMVTMLRNGSANSTPTGYVHLPGDFSVPMVIGQATDPLVTVVDGTGVHANVTVHVPLGTVQEMPITGTDNGLGIIDATQPYMILTCETCTMNTSGVAASGTIITAHNGIAIDDGAGPIMMDALTLQPGTGNAFGTIQDFELTAANADPDYFPQHMLAYELDPNMCNSNGPIWPLLDIDNSFPNTGILPQGLTIGIPADVTMPTGQTRGFKFLWDIFQQFGGIFYNVSGNGCLSFGCYWSTSANEALANDIASSLSAIMAYMCILNPGNAPDYNTGIAGAQFSQATQKGMATGGTNAFAAPPPLDLSPTGGVDVAPSTMGAFYPSGYDVTPNNT